MRSAGCRRRNRLLEPRPSADRRGESGGIRQRPCQGSPSFLDAALYGLEDFLVAQHPSPRRSSRAADARPSVDVLPAGGQGSTRLPPTAPALHGGPPGRAPRSQPAPIGSPADLMGKAPEKARRRTSHRRAAGSVTTSKNAGPMPGPCMECGATRPASTRRLLRTRPPWARPPGRGADVGAGAFSMGHGGAHVIPDRFRQGLRCRPVRIVLTTRQASHLGQASGGVWTGRGNRSGRRVTARGRSSTGSMRSTSRSS